MWLAEELAHFLVPMAPTATVKWPEAHLALAAAVLMDMEQAGQVTFNDGRVTVRTDDGHPLAPDLEDGTVPEVLRTIRPGVYRRLLDRLTDQGVVAVRQRRWTFGVRAKTIWTDADGDRWEGFNEELVAVVAGEIAPTPRTTALVGLLHALEMDFVFENPPPGGWESWEAGLTASKLTKALLEAVEFGIPETGWDSLGMGGGGG
jgi:hypothetical protein